MLHPPDTSPSDTSPAAQALLALETLKEHADPSRLEHMAKFGINTAKALGVQIPPQRAAAKALNKRLRTPQARHDAAAALWETGIHEARIMASMVDAPALVSAEQMDAWTRDFNSWDLCDQCCNNLFRHTPFAFAKVREWGDQPVNAPEFSKRAGFTLLATLAVGKKDAPDHTFEEFFPLLLKHCADPRNFVKKSVNWALRNIGKRSKTLLPKAVAVAEEMARMQSKAARWCARDALREFHDPKTLARIR